MRKKVVQVKQSPLNEQRWMLVLECGHEVWVTAKRRPKRKTEKCECSAEREQGVALNDKAKAT